MLNQHQTEIIKKVTKKYKPKSIGVFGSYARNEQNKKSDLDILIDFDEDLNLLELIGIEQELSEKLKVKVDLITKRSLNKNLKEYIEEDLIQLL